MVEGCVIPGVFVGVDSGGTRTNVEILAVMPDGVELSAAYETTDCLSGALPREEIPGVLTKIVAPLEVHLDDLNVDGLPLFIWVSAAGFSAWTRDQFSTALYNLDGALSHHPPKSVGAANDAVTLLLGSRADGIVIAGTGSNVVVNSKDGNLYQSGGHEWVASDYGSGFWIGLEAIRGAYRDFEAGAHSVLLQRLKQVYGIRDGDSKGLIAKLRDLAVGDANFKKEIARFAASVCSAAERGDRAAQNIVKSQAEDLADVTALALRRCFTMEELIDGIRLVECGSLLGNSFYRKSFEAQLNMRLLSDLDQQVEVLNERFVTGTSQAIQLAKDLAQDSDHLRKLTDIFRPAIVSNLG